MHTCMHTYIAWACEVCLRARARARRQRKGMPVIDDGVHLCWHCLAGNVCVLTRLTLGMQVVQSPHIEFHLKWAEGVLLNHGSHIMAERATFSSSLRALHMGFSKQFGGTCTAPHLLLVQCCCCILIPFPGPPAPCIDSNLSCVQLVMRPGRALLSMLIMSLYSVP